MTSEQNLKFVQLKKVCRTYLHRDILRNVCIRIRQVYVQSNLNAKGRYIEIFELLSRGREGDLRFVGLSGSYSISGVRMRLAVSLGDPKWKRHARTRASCRVEAQQIEVRVFLSRSDNRQMSQCAAREYVTPDKEFRP